MFQVVTAFIKRASNITAKCLDNLRAITKSVMGHFFLQHNVKSNWKLTGCHNTVFFSIVTNTRWVMVVAQLLCGATGWGGLTTPHVTVLANKLICEHTDKLLRNNILNSLGISLSGVKEFCIIKELSAMSIQISDVNSKRAVIRSVLTSQKCDFKLSFVGNHSSQH